MGIINKHQWWYGIVVTFTFMGIINKHQWWYGIVVTFTFCPISRYFRCLSIISFVFLLKHVSEDDSCRWPSLSSADFLRIFSLSGGLRFVERFFVSKCLCRCQRRDAHAGVFSFAPACYIDELSFASDRRFFLVSPFRLFRRVFQSTRILQTLVIISTWY
jgi:hypothetical protein